MGIIELLEEEFKQQGRKKGLKEGRQEGKLEGVNLTLAIISLLQKGENTLAIAKKSDVKEGVVLKVKATLENN